MIPPEAWSRSLHILFGMVAARRGPHWKLNVMTAEQNPFGNGPLDEGQLLGESVAAVMAHVPLPTRELGIVNDLTVCGFAFYAAINSRLELDRQIAKAYAAGATGARPAGPASTQTFEVTGRHEPTQRPAESEVEVTAADLLAAMPTEPLAAVTHNGDPVHDGVQLGRSVTAELGNNEDPEPVLLAAFRPGEEAVPIDVLAASGEGNVLDRLAPPIEVEGVAAVRELGDSQPAS